MDGQAANPEARAINYVAVAGSTKGRVSLIDQVSGDTLVVEPRVVINAAGPWIDRVNQSVGLNKTYIGGTKGSHLILDNPELVRQIDGHMIYFGTSDGRICLVYPFYGHALIGSTDIPASDPDNVGCSDAEAEYMLGMVGEVFPGLALGLDQIIYRYAGIRPLPAAEFDDPGDITRDHSISRDALPASDVPILSLIGGKWTTFRAFAAEATDAALETLGRVRRTSTEHAPIGGGREFPVSEEARRQWIARNVQAHHVSPERAAILLDRYGARAEAILADYADRIDTPLTSQPADLRA